MPNSANESSRTWAKKSSNFRSHEFCNRTFTGWKIQKTIHYDKILLWLGMESAPADIDTNHFVITNDQILVSPVTAVPNILSIDRETHFKRRFCIRMLIMSVFKTYGYWLLNVPCENKKFSQSHFLFHIFLLCRGETGNLVNGLSKLTYLGFILELYVVEYILVKTQRKHKCVACYLPILVEKETFRRSVRKKKLALFG